jgi:succinoglycan biosynthesis transport protein ExoP
LNDRTQTAAWLIPEGQQQGLRRYVEILRERFWLILAAVAAATLAAGLYVTLADDVYKARSQLLVTPVASDDTILTGLGLIRDSNDPTRDVETAAKLVTTTDVAARVRRKLDLNRSSRSLLEDVKADPVAQSNIVAITAEGSSPRLARSLANSFGDALVEDRTEQFHAQLDKAVRNLRARIRSVPAEQLGSGPESLPNQLARLDALRGGNDPTVRVETRATLPDSPSWPKTKLSLLAGLIAGLILGTGGAFALEALDPRLRREEQLRSLYRLPVLARIPEDKRRPHPLAPNHLSPATAEAFRTLRATLAASHNREGGSHSVLVTGPSPSEGKTTTAVNLACSLALAGNRVILVEADLRRPGIANALKVKPKRGIVSVLMGNVPLSEALVTTTGFGPNLQLLLVERTGEVMVDWLFLPAARSLLDDAKQMADYVIMDSPPLTEVIDALPLAQQADDVLIVVRLGKSHLTKLAQLGELLARHGIKPVGFALSGVVPSGGGAYYTEHYPSLPEELRPPVLTR